MCVLSSEINPAQSWTVCCLSLCVMMLLSKRNAHWLFWYIWRQYGEPWPFDWTQIGERCDWFFSCQQWRRCQWQCRFNHSNSSPLLLWLKAFFCCIKISVHVSQPVMVSNLIFSRGYHRRRDKNLSINFSPQQFDSTILNYSLEKISGFRQLPTYSRARRQKLG